jgi:predicted porin
LALGNLSLYSTLENFEMKKTLVAIAALSAISAFAQSSVTMYGLIDAGVDQRINTAADGVTTNTTAIAFGAFNTNRIGFKGTEDLGGGMKTNFVIETGVAYGAAPADSSVQLTGANGGTSLGDRAAFVELEGSFGKITAGRQNTGARDLFVAFDAGGALNVAGSLNSSTGNDAGNPASYAAGTSVNSGSHGTFAQAIKYTAPTYNGLTVAGSFTKNTVNYSNTSADIRTAQGYSFGGNYVNGPLSVGISYANAVTTAVTTALDAALIGDITTKTTAAGASYDLGKAKLYVAHFKLDQVNDIAPTATTGMNINRKSTTYGVSAPVTGNISVFASMGTGTLQVGGGTFERDLKATQMGANYSLSKRSTIKFAYGTTKSDATATTETKVKETALALVHTF